jgi:Ras-related protein Rab-1A
MIHVPEEDQLLVFGGAETDQAEAGILYSIKLGTTTWTRVETQSTPPLERSFHSFDLIGNRGFVFAGQTSTEVTDLYIFDTANQRWAKPLYEGQLNVRAHASAVLHDKLIVFGGVRDKASADAKPKKSDEKHRISKKLFFLNVLEIKDGVSEGDFKFKLVTIGDSGVGKSCLLTRFVQDYYADFHVSTIGVDFKTVITMVKGRLVKLQLWDTAGQERFSVVTGNYYRNSDGFIFVYDCTNRASFEHVDQWLGQVQQHHECGPTTMKILVGNKADMKNDLQITEAEGRAKAEAMGAYFVSTSAKTAAGVDMAFLMAAQNLVEMRRQATQQQPKSLQLNQANTRTQPATAMGGKCCAGGGAGLGRR